MKKELLEWIDRETIRLDRLHDNREPDNDESDPVPEALRRALADTAPEKPLQKH